MQGQVGGGQRRRCSSIAQLTPGINHDAGIGTTIYHATRTKCDVLGLDRDVSVGVRQVQTRYGRITEVHIWTSRSKCERAGLGQRATGSNRLDRDISNGQDIAKAEIAIEIDVDTIGSGNIATRNTLHRQIARRQIKMRIGCSNRLAVRKVKRSVTRYTNANGTSTLGTRDILIRHYG